MQTRNTPKESHTPFNSLLRYSNPGNNWVHVHTYLLSTIKMTRGIFTQVGWDGCSLQKCEEEEETMTWSRVLFVQKSETKRVMGRIS
jgi:hypothetical protein